MTTITMNKSEDLSYNVDCLMDRLTEVLLEVDAGFYTNMSKSQQWDVKNKFYESIKKDEIIINQYLVNVAKAQGSVLLVQLLEERNNINPAHSKFKQAYEQLTNGRKVTIVKFSEFGFPILINTTIERVELQPYAQYRDAMKLIHKPKRKKSLYANWFYGSSEIVVYDGWLDIDLNKLSNVTLKDNQHVTVTQSKYCSFDKTFLSDIRQAIKTEPIVNIQ